MRLILMNGQTDARDVTTATDINGLMRVRFEYFNSESSFLYFCYVIVYFGRRVC